MDGSGTLTKGNGKHKAKQGRGECHLHGQQRDNKHGGTRSLVAKARAPACMWTVVHTAEGQRGSTHGVCREQEEVPLVLVEAQEGGCMDMGNNKWWTRWMGVGRPPKEMESTKPNNEEESVICMGSNGTTSTAGPKGSSPKCGPRHACGLWCTPPRAKEGVLRCSHGHWMHLKCAGVTVFQGKEGFPQQQGVPMHVQKGKASQMVTGQKRQAPIEEERATNMTREVRWAPEEQHPKPQAGVEPEQSNSASAEVVVVDGHHIVIGGRAPLTGMRKKKELEGKMGEVERIMEEQGNLRVQMD